MRLILAVVAGLAAGSAAGQTVEADNLSAKKCIMAAGENLPKLPNMSKLESKALDTDRAVASKFIIDSSVVTERNAEDVTYTFDIGDFSFRDGLREAFHSSGMGNVKQILHRELSKSITKAFRVEIDVNAIGQDSTLSFMCAITKAGDPVVFPMGMTK